MSAARVREPALSLLDRLQYIPADLQIETLAAALVIVANAAGLDAHDLVSRAKRQQGSIEGVETDVLALAEYAKGELRDPRN
ncbi:hypothetical protein [Novosphingobium meiothermophilum]|uniref:hypothetical protein n=1 Tax=Novosphingobium meiothermophilum TaxID=2202251 RepID=UPI000D6E43CF|nr:hypothetical protein [Novosphingobium meiothermophilum]